MSSTTTELTKQEQLELYALVENLKQLPGGEIMTNLEEKLTPEQIKELAAEVISEMRKFVLASVIPEIRDELIDLEEQENFEDWSNLIIGMSMTDPNFKQIVAQGMASGYNNFSNQFNLQ